MPETTVTKTVKKTKKKPYKKKTYKKRVTDISKYNRLPLKMRRQLTLRYKTDMYLPTGAAGNRSNTCFYSLSSLKDPDFTNTGKNMGFAYYTMFFGYTTALYEHFQVRYTDLYFKVMNTVPNTRVKLCIGVSANGAGEYPVTQRISTIASYPQTTSRSLEYLGDTKYSFVKFRVYPWKVLGVTKKEYFSSSTWRHLWDRDASAGPWVCVSIGRADDAVTNSLDEDVVSGEVTIVQHLNAYDPQTEFTEVAGN